MNPRRPRANVKPILLLTWRICKNNGLPHDLRKVLLRQLHAFTWTAEWAHISPRPYRHAHWHNYMMEGYLALTVMRGRVLPELKDATRWFKEIGPLEDHYYIRAFRAHPTLYQPLRILWFRDESQK